MAKNNSSNLDITNNADGFDVSGGTTVRKLTVTGGDVVLDGSGTGTLTLPTGPDTLVARTSTDTLTNKTFGDDIVLDEAADHSSTPTAGEGYLWVRNDTPNVLVFTDDAGTDTVLGAGGGGGNVSNTGTPVDNQLAVWTDATTVEGDADLTFDTTTNRLDVPNINLGSNDEASGNFSLSNDAASTLQLYTYSDTAGVSPGFQGRRARGTKGSETATQSGDTLFFLGGRGHYGTLWNNQANAEIYFKATENHSTINDNGAKTEFYTTANGANTSTLALTLDQDQSMTVANDIVIPEAADHTSTPTAGFGYLWVKSDTPNTLMFTDDAGTDTDLLAVGSGDVTKVGTPVDNQLGVWTGDGTIEGDADFTFDGSTATIVNTSAGGVTRPLVIKNSSITDNTTVGINFAATTGAGPTGYIQMDRTAGLELAASAGTTHMTIDTSGNVDLNASTALSWASTNILSDSAGTMTLSNIDALDATTDTTITNAMPTASDSVSGFVELATIAETDTGTDTGRAVTPDGLQGSIRNLRFIDFVVVDPATDVATGTGLVTWSAPFAGTIVQDDTDVDWFAAYTTTAGTTGTMEVDIHKNGTTIMTTNKLDIETTELDTTTAATQPDLTTTSISKGDVFTIDVDAVHTTAAKGLVVRMAVRPD